jgi:hypothetical protein
MTSRNSNTKNAEDKYDDFKIDGPAEIKKERKDGQYDMKEDIQNNISLLSKDDENRRLAKWRNFTKPRIIFGFDHMHKADIPAMANKPRGLVLLFSRIIGWYIPREINVHDTLHTYSIQLSLSLYHINTGYFFGSTWLGSPVPLMENPNDHLPDIIDVDYNEIVYLITRLTDPSCVGVVEIVASKHQVHGNLLVSQHG